MPPIRQVDDAFLSSLLEKQAYPELKVNIDSESLTSILNKLNSTSDALQQELFEKVYSHFDDFSTWYNSSQELHANVLDLVKQTSHTQQQVMSSQQQVNATIEKYQLALKESHKNKSKIDILEHIEQILQIMQLLEAELKQYNYVHAVQHILYLSTILKDWSMNNDHGATNSLDHHRVIQMIHGRIQHLKQTLVLGLQDGLHTAIKYNSGSIRILETYQPSPNKQVHIRDIFQSLFQLGLLPEELMNVQRSIFKNILNFYFEYSNCTLQIDPVQVENEGQGGVLQIIPTVFDNDDGYDGKDQGCVDPVIMLQRIKTILDFIYKYTFTQSNSNTTDDKEMKLLFGNLFMPDLVKMMINKSIAPAIPSSKYNLTDFDHVIQAVYQFEKHCKEEFGFRLEEATLSSYVENIDRHYAKKRRNRILQEGRKVMMRRLYDTEMTSVPEDDGHTYHYQITQTPQILSVLVSDTLSEGADLLHSHPISASTLMDGIQDLLDMYRSIMPSYHRNQYLDSAGSSLVFRNDCFWLANQITTTIAVKPEASQFPTLNAGLQSAAKRLRQLGKAWHELAMMQRVQMVQTELDHLDGFAGMAENAKFQQDCDRAISRVIELVGSFAADIRPVIDETLFLDMLGRIVDSVLARLISDIEELIDIGAEESHIIARTLNSLAQLVGAFDLPSRDATEGFVAELVPSWQKFWLVKDILEMNMRDIMEAFRRGDLHMFEKSELIGLLCSLFADTELREANIQEIKTGRLPYTDINKDTNNNTDNNNIALHQPQQTMAREMPTPAATALPAATPSIYHSLVYTPDDEAIEESGWGDDDLFADENDNKSIVPQTSLAPSPHLEYIEPNTSRTTGVGGVDDPEGGGGWGDADEDLFDNDTLLLINKEDAGNNSQDPGVKQHQEESIPRDTRPTNYTNLNNTPTLNLLSAPALDLEAEQEEGDGWGWNDDDDDELFK